VQVGRSAAAGRMTGGAGVRGRRKVGGAAGTEEARGYDYVEVMACPGGTVNGGGQIRPPSTRQNLGATTEIVYRDENGGSSEVDAELEIAPMRWGDRDWIERVEANYWEGLPSYESSAHDQLAMADTLAQRVLTDLCQPQYPCVAWSATMDKAAEERRRTCLRTEYRAVVSEVIGLAVKW
jgi:hypothetical protein